MPITEDLEIELKTEQNRAVIEGKTSVPFKTFVSLVLQRKVFNLFKVWGNDPVIISSALLTGLASAPQDSQENRASLILVTLGVGTLFGVFLSAVAMAGLLSVNVIFGMREYLLVISVIAGLAVLTFALGKMKRGSRGQQVADTMEKVAAILSKR